jgi:hypothetical protein
MNIDLFLHSVPEAVTALLDCPALEATLTWDGASNYRIGPSEKYAPLDDEHRAILTRDALLEYLQGDDSKAAIQAAAAWVSSSQREWFNESN